MTVKRQWLPRLVPVLLLLLLAACGQEDTGEAKATGKGGGPGKGKWGKGPATLAAIPVKTEAVRRGEMLTYVETHARLEAERQVDVLARTTGMVEEITVEEGHRAREGQILVRLDKGELELRLQQSQVALQQVTATYNRTLALRERGMVSESEFETVRHQFENAQVGYKEAELKLGYTDIRAPMPGVVMQRLIEEGDLMRANQPVLVVADLEPLLARIFIPEKRMHQIRERQEAQVRIESLPDGTFTGKIRMINPGVDPESGTVKVTLEIADTSGRLKPGMFATVRIITDRHARALVIPKKALIIETDEDDVFAVVDGKARRTQVELGFIEGDDVEVLAGLEEGDPVITVGQEGLKDGTPVRLVGAAAPAGLEDEAKDVGPPDSANRAAGQKKKPAAGKRDG